MRPLHFKGQSISRSKGKLCSSLALANGDLDGHRFSTSAISSKAASGPALRWTKQVGQMESKKETRKHRCLPPKSACRLLDTFRVKHHSVAHVCE